MINSQGQSQRLSHSDRCVTCLWMQDKDNYELVDVFHQVCTVLCQSALIGNFRSECQHRYNEAIQASTRHLGAAKKWTKMAAEAFLHAVQFQHEKVVGQRR